MEAVSCLVGPNPPISESLSKVISESEDVYHEEDESFENEVIGQQAINNRVS